MVTMVAMSRSLANSCAVTGSGRRLLRTSEKLTVVPLERAMWSVESGMGAGMGRAAREWYLMRERSAHVSSLAVGVSGKIQVLRFGSLLSSALISSLMDGEGSSSMGRRVSKHPFARSTYTSSVSVSWNSNRQCGATAKTQ